MQKVLQPQTFCKEQWRVNFGFLFAAMDRTNCHRSLDIEFIDYKEVNSYFACLIKKLVAILQSLFVRRFISLSLLRAFVWNDMNDGHRHQYSTILFVILKIVVSTPTTQQKFNVRRILRN